MVGIHTLVYKTGIHTYSTIKQEDIKVMVYGSNIFNTIKQEEMV
jgi:hypothetical protein